MARRHWEFDLADRHHVIDLEHGYFFGKRKLTIDGVTTVQRGTPLTDHSGEYPIPLAGHDARVRIWTNGLSYFYDLVVDGRSISSGQTAGTPPRPIAGSSGYLRAMGVVMILISIPSLYFFTDAAHDEYRYRTGSETAGGIVQDKRTIGGRNTSYELSYVFVARDGGVYTGRDNVSRRAFESARTGSRYTIQYLVDEPETNRFSGNDDIGAVAGVGLVTLAGAGIGAFMFLSATRHIAMRKRLATYGQPINATVTRLKAQSVRGVGKTVLVEYAYDDPFGKRRKGRGPLMYPNEAASYVVGGPARVLIDPDRPGDSVLA
jgi:hypothetical protein